MARRLDAIAMNTPRHNKTLLALIVLTFSMSGFLAIYISRNLSGGSSQRTAAILDKFESASPEPESDRSAAPGLLTKLSGQEVIAPVSGTRSGTVVYYEKSTGRVLEVGLDGKNENAISNSKLSDLIGTVWSPDRKSVVSLFASKSGPQYRYYNYNDKHTSALTGQVKAVAFSPDSKRIAYFIPGETDGGIFLSNPDGSDGKRILPTRIPDLDLYWPAPDFLYAISKNTATGTQGLYRIDVSGGFRTITEEQKGLEVLFSLEGNSFLISSFGPDEKLNLYYQDASSPVQIRLPLSTFSSKCAWSLNGKAITCGVPANSISGLERSSSAAIPDDIFDLDLATGVKRSVYSSGRDGNLSVLNPFLSPLESHLIFINGFDQKLYSLRKP